MVVLAFGDRLMLEKSEGQESTFDIAFEGPAHGDSVDWPLESDLAFRSHRLLSEHTSKPLPVRLRLGKQIPIGAGLGGGSSNAAGMLIGLNRLFELGLDNGLLKRLSTQLGSDVTFLVAAMLGEPAAVVSGFGERIEPICLTEVLHLALIFPPFASSTRRVYAVFDESVDATTQPNRQRVDEIVARPRISAEEPFNDLAEPACRVQPKLDQIRHRVQQTLKTPVHITGSGSALFVIGPSAAGAERMAQSVRSDLGVPAIATRTVTK